VQPTQQRDQLLKLKRRYKSPLLLTRSVVLSRVEFLIKRGSVNKDIQYTARPKWGVVNRFDLSQKAVA
jgi:hypothetical protein